MATYKLNYEGEILKIEFGTPAQNDQIVKDAREAAEQIKNDLMGLEILKISGPASIPVAMVLAHEFNHIVGAIACFDPKLNKFVVCISHNPKYQIGNLID